MADHIKILTIETKIAHSGFETLSRQDRWGWFETTLLTVRHWEAFTINHHSTY